MTDQNFPKEFDFGKDFKIEPISHDMTVSDLLDAYPDCRIFVDKNGIPHRVCGRITPEADAQIDILKGL